MEPATLYLVLTVGVAAVWLAGEWISVGAIWMVRSVSLSGPALRGVITVGVAMLVTAASWRVSSASAAVVPQPHRTITSHEVTQTLDGPAFTFLSIVDEAAHTSPTYTVRSGDCLWRIARSMIIGDGDVPTGAMITTLWQRIYDMNTDVIGANPRLIFPGQILTLPQR